MRKASPWSARQNTSASLAEVAPAVSTMLLGSKATLKPRCSDMNRANACGVSQPLLSSLQ
jgi:hypothetical protein